MQTSSFEFTRKNVFASYIAAKTNVFLVWVNYSLPVCKMDLTGINDK